VEGAQRVNEFLLITGMALVTFAVRYPVLALVGKIQMPERIFKALRYVPPSVLAAIILPEMVLREGQLALSPDNARLVAGIVGGLVAWRTKNLLLTIVLGMLTLWAWGALIG
jgi:branched-subunit amino acid transport protein